MKHSIKKSLKKIGIPTLNLKMEGHTYRFLIDTGSTFNYIASSAFLKLKDEMKVVGETRTSGLNGMAAEQKIVNIKYTLGRRQQEEKFGIMSDSTFKELIEKTGIQIDGIVGLPFFVRNRVKIDYEAGFAEFHTPKEKRA